MPRQEYYTQAIVANLPSEIMLGDINDITGTVTDKPRQLADGTTPTTLAWVGSDGGATPVNVLGVLAKLQGLVSAGDWQSLLVESITNPNLLIGLRQGANQASVDTGGRLLSRIVGSQSQLLPQESASPYEQQISINKSNIMVPVDAQSNYRPLLASTTTALGAGASYTSSSQEVAEGLNVSHYSKVTGIVYADVNGTLHVEQDVDDTWTSNEYIDDSIAVTGTTPLKFSIELVGRYVRIRYVNGGSAQTTFKLYAWLMAI